MFGAMTARSLIGLGEAVSRLRYAVARPLNRFKIEVISRHRTIVRAREKASQLGLGEGSVFKTNGGLPAAGAIFDREDFRGEFTVVPKDTKDRRDRPDRLENVLKKRRKKRLQARREGG